MVQVYSNATANDYYSQNGLTKYDLFFRSIYTIRMLPWFERGYSPTQKLWFMSNYSIITKIKNLETNMVNINESSLLCPCQ